MLGIHSDDVRVVAILCYSGYSSGLTILICADVALS